MALQYTLMGAKVDQLLDIKPPLRDTLGFHRETHQRPGPVSSTHCTTTPGLARRTFLGHPAGPSRLQRAWQLSLGLPVSCRPQLTPSYPIPRWSAPSQMQTGAQQPGEITGGDGEEPGLPGSVKEASLT